MARISGNAIAVIVCLAIPVVGITMAIVQPWWIAWHGPSKEVTGAVLTVHDGAAYVTVSGFAEQTWQEQKRTRSAAYPRLMTLRASDGETVKIRQYTPLYLRFSYVDTVVRAVVAGGGRVWVDSTGPEALHAVDPLSLEDVVPWTSLVAAEPALGAGMHHELSQDSVLVERGAIVFRGESGAWFTVDPAASTAKQDPEAAMAWEDRRRRSWPPASLKPIDAAAVERPGALSPRLTEVYDAAGADVPNTALVFTQGTLDALTAPVRVARWDVHDGAATEVWGTELPDVHPGCCEHRAWKTDGAMVVWYEGWVFALDEATGALRWIREV